jgi:OOP family OmpA-OmpF porin
MHCPAEKQDATNRYGRMNWSVANACQLSVCQLLLLPIRTLRSFTAASLERREFMKKLNMVAVLFASAALAAPVAVSAAAHSGGMPKSVDNWQNPFGLTWKGGAASDLCWRDANWTPATAAAECDGAIKPTPPAPAPVAAPVAPPAAPVAPAAPAAAPKAPAAPVPVPVPVPAAPVSEKVTFAADAFFDFNKAALKPEAKAKLDDLVGKTSSVNLEVIIAVGHTDSVGTDAYNQKLSVQRSEAVKAYLVTKGIEKNRVYTEGKGEKQPVADNKTAEGRAKNRRVEIEVVGTRTKK